MATIAITKQRIDLVNQALSVLGVLAAGQAPSPEDFEECSDHLDGLLASLARRDIVVIDDPDAIPIEFFLPLGVLLADAASDAFGQPGVPPSASNRDPVADAITEIREIVYARPTFEPLRTQYF